MNSKKATQKSKTTDGQSVSIIFYNYSEAKQNLIEEATKKSPSQNGEYNFYIINQNIEKSGSTSNTSNNLSFITQENRIKGISSAINQSDKENILLIDVSRFDKKIDLVNILHTTKSEKQTPQAITFQNDNIKNNKASNTYPALYIPKEMASYIFESLPSGDNNIQANIFFILKRLKIELKNRIINTDASLSAGIDKKEKNILKKSGHDLSLNLYWLFSLPIKEISTSPHKQYTFIKENSINRLIFVVLAVALLVTMSFFSQNAGISGDEDKHVAQAEKVYNYFKTDGEDQSYKKSRWGPFYAYNVSYDVFLYSLINLFDIENIYNFRHFVTAVTGWLAILFCGLLAVVIAGWRAGILTMLIVFLTPQFLGHSYNNPKDIPFAFSYVFALFFLFRMFRDYPRIKISNSIMLALAIGISLNIRIGGLLIIPYMLMFAGLKHLIITNKNELFGQESLNRLKNLFIHMILLSAAGYILGILFWPFALEDPINNPIKSLDIMTNFTVSLRQIYEGNFLWSDKVPWYYAIKYILISAPIIFLTGLVLVIFLIRKVFKQHDNLSIFMLFFTALFPIAYVIYKKSNVYGGWRHLLFAYQIAAILSAIGYVTLFKAARSKIFSWIIYAFTAFLAVLPFIHIIKNHPHEYIYYNAFVNGVNGAYGHYETDYYYHSDRAGIEYLMDNVLDTALQNRDEITIAANHSPRVYKHYIKKYEQHEKVNIKYIRYYEKGNKDWDYAIMINSYLNPEQLRKDNWPPNNAIHVIRVSDAPICAILKRKTKADYKGYEAMQNGNNIEAINYFKEALKHDPENETALYNLASVYLEMNMLKEAKKTAIKGLKVVPNWDRLLNVLGNIFMRQNKLDKALVVFNQLVDVNYKYYTAYYNLALIHLRKGNSREAANYAQKCIEANGKFKAAYYLMAEILKREGKNQQAQRYINFVKNNLQ